MTTTWVDETTSIIKERKCYKLAECEHLARITCRKCATHHVSHMTGHCARFAHFSQSLTSQAIVWESLAKLIAYDEKHWKRVFPLLCGYHCLRGSILVQSLVGCSVEAASVLVSFFCIQDIHIQSAGKTVYFAISLIIEWLRVGRIHIWYFHCENQETRAIKSFIVDLNWRCDW